MGKYSVLMSCGHVQTVQLFGKEADRRRKIAYFEESGLCNECYKEAMEAAAKAEGLIFNASVLPQVDDKSGSILMAVWFSGDTKSHKEEIKALGGYHWGERKSAEDYFWNTDSPLCWKKVIKMEDLEKEVSKATSIGAVDVKVDNGLASVRCHRIAEWTQQDWKERNDKLASLVKPVIPTIIKGHYWNEKTYGVPGNYSIYLDDEKVTITDRQAKELNEYVHALTGYRSEVQKIEAERKSPEEYVRAFFSLVRSR